MSTESKGKQGDISSLSERKADRQFPPDKGGKGGYIPYNKTLTEKARKNRKNPTPAEQKLWHEVLQSKRLDNLKFTRQKPLDEYIVDFYCAKLMLAIKIDGDTHAGQKQYDEDRTKNLNKYGVEVIRYTNAEVLNNLEGVYQDLHKRISARKPPKSPLPRDWIINPLNPPYQGDLTIITLSMAFSHFILCFMSICAKLSQSFGFANPKRAGKLLI